MNKKSCDKCGNSVTPRRHHKHCRVCLWCDKCGHSNTHKKHIYDAVDTYWFCLNRRWNYGTRILGKGGSYVMLKGVCPPFFIFIFLWTKHMDKISGQKIWTKKIKKEQKKITNKGQKKYKRDKKNKKYYIPSRIG